MTTIGDRGRIVATELFDGGADYAEDDSFNHGDLEGVVDTVDGGGAVLTYHLTNSGTDSYLFDQTLEINGTNGSGTGLILTVTEVTTGDGSVQLTIEYIVLDTTLYP